jgi:hypothetical protein
MDSIAEKFKTGYAPLGFSDKANPAEGVMRPVAYAVKELTAAEEEKIGGLVTKVAG